MTLATKIRTDIETLNRSATIAEALDNNTQLTLACEHAAAMVMLDVGDDADESDTLAVALGIRRALHYLKFDLHIDLTPAGDRLVSGLAEFEKKVHERRVNATFRIKTGTREADALDQRHGRGDYGTDPEDV